MPELSGGRVATAEGAGHLQSRGGIGKDEMTLFIMEVSKDHPRHGYHTEQYSRLRPSIVTPLILAETPLESLEITKG